MIVLFGFGRRVATFFEPTRRCDSDFFQECRSNPKTHDQYFENTPTQNMIFKTVCRTHLFSFENLMAQCHTMFQRPLKFWLQSNPTKIMETIEKWIGIATLFESLQSNFQGALKLCLKLCNETFRGHWKFHWNFQSSFHTSLKVYSKTFNPQNHTYLKVIY